MEFDYIILGAGLAGLSLASSLLDYEKSVLVLETEDIGAGASGTPVGMVNPATGRRGKKVWRIEQALPAIYKSLQTADASIDQSIYVQHGVLRPALDPEMAGEMYKRYKKAQWPVGWCYWLTEKEIKAFHPGIQCVNGGLWLPVGMAVDVPNYLNALAIKITDKGGKLTIRPSYTYHQRQNKGWEIVTDRKEKMVGKNIIFATGANMPDHSLWTFLPLNAVKGQVALFHVDSPLDFEYSISAKGYIAHINNYQFTVGSTYEHEYRDQKPDTDGLRQLKNTLEAILPGLSQKATLSSQWGGVRVSTSDHKPVLGPHPRFSDLYIFTGLGSKGLLHGKYLANQLAAHMIKGSSLPADVNINRFNR